RMFPGIAVYFDHKTLGFRTGFYICTDIMDSFDLSEKQQHIPAVINTGKEYVGRLLYLSFLVNVFVTQVAAVQRAVYRNTKKGIVENGILGIIDIEVCKSTGRRYTRCRAFPGIPVGDITDYFFLMVRRGGISARIYLGIWDVTECQK